MRRALAPALLAAALVAAWQLAASSGALASVLGLERFLVPSPAEICSALWRDRGLLADNAQVTLRAVLLGFACAFAAGVGFAIAMHLSGLVRRSTYPLMIASQTVPIIVVAPILVLWFGFGLLPKVIVVVLVTFFPIVVAVLDGFAATDPEAERLLRSMGASRRQVFWRARVPSALPGLFTGMRISISYAVTAAVVAEYVGAERGLGIWMQQSKAAFQTDLVFGAMLVTALISTTLFLLVNAIAHLAIPWHYAQRRRA